MVPELIVTFDASLVPPMLLPPYIVSKVPESIIISVTGTFPAWLAPP